MVAVVVVVLDHLVGWPPGGFVGVDVFFVISGFLITGLLLREHERTGTISFWGFYKRRIKRIIPVAVVATALTVGAAWFLFNRARFSSTLSDGLYATLFTANWHMAAVGTDYFRAEAAVSPLQHYWSLSVEEQFYFVWPWLMLLIFVVTARLTTWSRRRARTTAGVVMLVITVTSFAWSLYETSTSPTWAYFSTFSRTWELGIGALIAVFAATFARIPGLVRPLVAWIGVAGIVASLLVITGESAFPAPWAALPVVSTALVIIAGTGGEQRFLWPLTNRVSRYVGDISYSMYIWHWPIIVFGLALGGDGPLTVAVLAVLVVLASVYSYHLLEDPIRTSSWLDHQPRLRRSNVPRVGMTTVQKALAVSLLGVVTVGVIGAALVRVQPTRSATVADHAPPSATPGATEGAAPSTTPQLDALHGELAVALTATEWPTLTPTMDEAMAARQAPDDVMACGFSTYDEARCTFGDPAAAQTAVVVGNSISMTFVRPLQLALADSGWKVVSYGMFGCPFADYSIAEVPEGVDGCAERPDAAVEAINRLSPGAVFVIGARPVDAAVAQLRKITVPTRIVYLPPPPQGANVTACYAPISAPADCVTELDDGWDRYEAAIAAQVEGVMLPTADWFCVQGSCPSFAGTTPTKRDLGHMTIQYGERIAPVIREAMIAQGLVQ